MHRHQGLGQWRRAGLPRLLRVLPRGRLPARVRVGGWRAVPPPRAQLLRVRQAADGRIRRHPLGGFAHGGSAAALQPPPVHLPPRLPSQARGEFAAELGEAVARPQLHTTAEDRVAACSARRRRNPEPQLLLFTRLPRVGNSLAVRRQRRTDHTALTVAPDDCDVTLLAIAAAPSRARLRLRKASSPQD